MTKELRRKVKIVYHILDLITSLCFMFIAIYFVEYINNYALAILCLFYLVKICIFAWLNGMIEVIQNADDD